MANGHGGLLYQTATVAIVVEHQHGEPEVQVSSPGFSQDFYPVNTFVFIKYLIFMLLIEQN